MEIGGLVLIIRDPWKWCGDTPFGPGTSRATLRLELRDIHQTMYDHDIFIHFQSSSRHDMTLGAQKGHDIIILRLTNHTCGSFVA